MRARQGEFCGWRGCGHTAYYRKLNGWTQNQLAERLEVSPGYLSLPESPATENAPSLKILFALADQFGVPPAKLIDFKE